MSTIRTCITHGPFGYYIAQQQYLPRVDYWIDTLRLSKYFDTQQEAELYMERMKELQFV